MFEAWHQELLSECRVARLATVMPNGRPRLLPVCYALHEGAIFIAVDEKPKRSTDLARIRDIRRDPRVTFLVDRYDEDWARLAWVRVEGEASVTDRAAWQPGALVSLRERYPQYREMALERLPLIEITPTRVVGWRSSG